MRRKSIITFAVLALLAALVGASASIVAAETLHSQTIEVDQDTEALRVLGENITNDTASVTITEHLDVLLDTGFLAKATIPVGERSRDLPYTFYYVTEAGRDLFDRNDIFDEAIWREQYEKVQKTPAIREIEGMDRPEPN